jgi:hypothetical protein
VIVPTRGAAGVTGCVLIVTLAEAGDKQPASFVTVKVYMPAGMTEMVAELPDPGVITPPGLRVTVQVPMEGRLLRMTLPVDNAHVG